jgi:hypothetical protein
MTESAIDRTPARGSHAELLFRQMIPSRDGVRLAANVFLPRERTGPVPAVVEFTPYSRDTSTPEAVRFASEGFAFVAVDCRGRGDSDGEFLGHHPGEIDDGYDIVEWIAEQEWCSGDVVMFGGSYTGQNQWTTAAGAPPHLRSIVPAAASMGGLGPGAGGIPMDHQFTWGMLTAGKTLSSRVFAESEMRIAMLVDAFERHESFRSLNARLGGPWGLPDAQNTTPQNAPWHPDYGPPVDRLCDISIPTLEVTGPYDIAERGALEHHRRFLAAAAPAARDLNYLVLGPWNHGNTLTGTTQVGGLHFGPAAEVDVMQLVIDWYRWVLFGEPFPEFLRDHVVYYVTGAEEWRSAPDLESITADTVPWYLAGHDGPHSAAHPGWLLPEATDTPAFSFVCDPDERATLELERQPRPEGQAQNPVVQLPEHHLNLADHLMGDDPTTYAFVASIDGFGAVYTSAVVREAIELAGRPRLDAWLVLDQPDADLAALLYELLPDGSAILLSPAVQRLRHRDPAKGVQLLTPGEPTLVSFTNFHWFARRIAAGSRLQLAIRHTGSIHMDRNHHTGRPDGHETPDHVRIAAVTVLHADDRRSVLHLPLAASAQPERGDHLHEA